MKIVVFADSHTDVDTMKIVTESEHPDMVIHLGDHVRDGAELQELFNNTPMEFVKGNTDKTDDCPAEKLIEVNDATIFLAHGDEYGVENGLDDIIDMGISYKADIIMFGHTHKSFLHNQDGLWIMNPGRIGRKSSKHINATFGVVIIDEGIINCKIAEFDAM